MPTVERLTVTLRADLLDQIDRVERNRSRFIAQAVVDGKGWVTEP
jgi:metal-responsive CopG/Arc/MetJ family transcriptional regulator